MITAAIIGEWVSIITFVCPVVNTIATDLCAGESNVVSLVSNFYSLAVGCAPVSAIGVGVVS